MTSRWVLPLGSAGSAEWDVVVDDRVDGWSHTGLFAGRLGAGDRRTLDTGAREVVVVPLSGPVRVTCTDTVGTTHTAALAGRPSVFTGPTDVAYVPRDSTLVLEAEGDCRVALAVASLPGTAPAESVPFRHLPAADVPTELRGAGRMSREVRNFGTPGVLDAERLIACEVVTPAGNWSSYPPHKHDEHRAGVESELEEIYYVEVQPESGAPVSPEADPLGYLRVYGTGDRDIDVFAEVRTGDVVLVPFGWHGPAMAAPGYDLYYLNVMAGPVHEGAERAWLITDDPAHGWVRETWAATPVDPRLPLEGPMTDTGERTVRLTVAQALVRFLAAQWTERDGERQKLFAGCLGIFGHGNVAGVGQALLENELHAEGDARLPYVLARNEQAMVHTAVGYARQKDRLQTWVCTASVGPGSTNMLTGAALATINRIPVLLLPSGTFATRVSGPVLQELEPPYAGDVTVNDAFRPLSRFFDRVARPEQLPPALLAAMRVLTDPVETGAVTIALPQDVQAEAFDWPEALFATRVWRIARPVPEAVDIEDAAALVRSARRPLVVAGGGVHYSGAEDALRAFCDATGIPVGETQAGKGSLLHGHPQLMGAIGSTGTTAANALAAEADVVIGVGTRWSDFTTASRTAFQDSNVRFVNINVARFDAAKHAGLEVVADAREALTALTAALDGYAVDAAYRDRQATLWLEWDAEVEASYHPSVDVTDALAEGLLTQSQVIGAVNELSDPRDVVLCAAGSMPGDLHKLWRVRDRKGYHVEYGYSCMGYEVPASIGIRLADPDCDVFALVGDGGYLMMPTELVTAAQERVKVIVVLVQNHGFHSIGSLSESLGSQRFGTRYRYRGEQSHRLDGDLIPVDLAANARSLGAHVIEVHSAGELEQAIKDAKAWPAAGGPVVIHVETDPFVFAPDNGAWWDVPVGEVSELDSTRAAHEAYTEQKRAQRPLLSPWDGPATDRTRKGS